MCLTAWLALLIYDITLEVIEWPGISDRLQSVRDDTVDVFHS